MTRSQWILAIISTISAGSAAFGCTPGGVGDPCVPEDEYTATFSGFGESEANVESRSFQCETRVCIANHFRGRVTCPYGQTTEYVSQDSGGAPVDPKTGDNPGFCYLPTSNNEIVTVPVQAQLLDRRAEDTVYCSCRCKGPDKSANYCSCPSGYSCLPLVPDLGFGQAQLVGSYCMKNGTQYSGSSTGSSCNYAVGNCASDRASNKNRNPPP